jgi:predicted DNA-binding transcriptional regulator AlpA
VLSVDNEPDTESLMKTLVRHEPKPERLLNWSDLRERGLVSSKTQTRRLWERGLFPRPIHLSERVIAWRESEINGWLETRTNDAPPA